MSATVRIQVIDSVFDCDTCANTIEQVLKQTAGVEQVQIGDETGQLEVRYDTTQTERDEIQRIIEEWGYTPAGDR